ncbi:hypothetical protein PRIC2_008870 [Phytophthora ramorum]
MVSRPPSQFGFSSRVNYVPLLEDLILTIPSILALRRGVGARISGPRTTNYLSRPRVVVAFCSSPHTKKVGKPRRNVEDVTISEKH